MKNLIKRIPVVFSISRFFYLIFIEPLKTFPGSEKLLETEI